MHTKEYRHERLYYTTYYYYTIIEKEKVFPKMYKRKLHRVLVEAYPNLSHPTDENVLSQLRAIKKNKFISEATIKSQEVVFLKG